MTSRLPFQQLLKNNDLGIIENPLRRIDEDDLENYIRDFHRECRLDSVVDVDTLICGAHLARDEEATLAEGLIRGDADYAALAKEKTTSIWTENLTDSWLTLQNSCRIRDLARPVERYSSPTHAQNPLPTDVGLGQILTSWQTGTALGIAISGAVTLIVPHSWRFQISSSFIPALVLLFLVFVGSESPRWLIKKQQYAEGYSVLLRLRENPLLAARDLVFIRAQLEVETILFMRSTNDVMELGSEVPRIDQRTYRRQISLLGYGRRIVQLFTIPRVRRSTLASFIVMTAQQMSGVNVFAFLASTLFDDAGIAHKGSLWLFFGFGVANFL
ncbi:MAG: hypothetical protein Q9167_003173 [Letrouitia subvulpina]